MNPEDAAFDALTAERQRVQRGARLPVARGSALAEWRAQAACAGLDPVWWDIDQPALWSMAAQVCGTCPVRQECLADHWDNPEAFGVYGGVPLEAGQRVARGLW